MPMGDRLFQRVVEAEQRARYAAIETAVEEALTGGVCGVLVDEEACSAGPSLAVPYGCCWAVGHARFGWSLR